MTGVSKNPLELENFVQGEEQRGIGSDLVTTHFSSSAGVARLERTVTATFGGHSRQYSVLTFPNRMRRRKVGLLTRKRRDTTEVYT